MKGYSHPRRIGGSPFYISNCTALRILFCAILVLCLPFLASAQDTGSIGGTVSDKSGAAVAGAEVTITSTAGSLTRSTVTNSDGAYVAAGLPGASYDLSVSAKGFQKYTAHGVVLDVAQKIRVDVQLTVGSVSEEVVVTGESVAQVETASSELSTTISGKQVNQLELNGRNFTQLVTLTPGVVSQTNQDEGTVGVYGNVAYSMNGGRTEYNNWELDGGDNMDNGSNSTLNVYPNVEAIAEFKVLTSNYGAQYGRNGRARSKSRPSPAAAPSTAAPSNTCATTSSMPNRGYPAASPATPTRLTRSTTSATPSAARYTFRTITTPTKERRSSSFPRNGEERRTPMRSFKTFPPLPNAAGISRICVQVPIARTFQIQRRCP